MPNDSGKMRWTIPIQGGPTLQAMLPALFEVNEEGGFSQDFSLSFVPKKKIFVFNNVQTIMALKIKVDSIGRLKINKDDIIFLIRGLVDSDDWEMYKPEMPLMASIIYSVKTQKGLADLVLDPDQLYNKAQIISNMLNGLYADEF